MVVSASANTFNAGQCYLLSFVLEQKSVLDTKKLSLYVYRFDIAYFLD